MTKKKINRKRKGKFKRNVPSVIEEGYVFKISKYEADGIQTRKEFLKLESSYTNCNMDMGDFGSIATEWYDEFIEERTKNFSIMASVDDVGYKKKLDTKNNEEDKEEFKRINNRIGRKMKVIPYIQFVDLVGNKGHSFCPAIFETQGNYAPRRKDTFLQQLIFALDFDEGISFDKVIQRAYKYKIPPTFAYKTLSCNDIELNKFRVVWIADFVVNGIKMAEAVIKLLMTIYPEADKACKDCCRLFFGGKGVIYQSSYAYLERLSLSNLVNAVHRYVEDNFRKNRLEKMRGLSQETGIVLKGGYLDIQEKRVSKKQIMQIGERIMPVDSRPCFRCFIDVKDYQEILGEKVFNDEDTIYIVIRKLEDDMNSLYFVRFKNEKKIKKMAKKIKQNNRQYKTKSNFEYKEIKNTVRGITKDMIIGKCKLCKDLFNDEYLKFNELFGICTNLINIEGGLTLFKSALKDSQYNVDRSNDWYNYKADQLNAQALVPTRCVNFCEYADKCKHSKNIIQTVKTKRNTVVVLKQIELLSLKQGTEVLEEIVKGVFKNE